MGQGRVPSGLRSFLAEIRIAPFSANLLLSALDPSEIDTPFSAGMKHKLFDVLRRIGFLVLVVWTVVSLVTLLIELVPGDPAIAVLTEQATPEELAQFRAKHGLDRPAFFFGFPQDENGRRHFRWYGLNNRYDDYWVAILHGDLGTSFRTDCPVAKAIFWSCGVQEMRWSDVFDDLLHLRFASLVHRIDPFLNSRFFST